MTMWHTKKRPGFALFLALSQLGATLAVGACGGSESATNPGENAEDAGTTTPTDDDAQVGDRPDASGDAGKVPAGDDQAPSVEVLAPLRDFAETRRLLRATVTDEGGLAKVSFALNGGAPKSVVVSQGAKSVTIAEVLQARAGENHLTIDVEDAAGNARSEAVDFRYGVVTTGGGAHSAVVVDGELWAWGRHNMGQAGAGDPTGDDKSVLSPAKVAIGAPAKKVLAVAFNQNDSLAIADDGSVWTWGANDAGQLGLGDTAKRSTPVRVPDVKASYGVLGFTHALVLTEDGHVMAWGDNGSGQVGDGSANPSKASPVAVSGLPNDVVKIIAGSDHSAALTSDGSVWIWGANDFGQHGAGVMDTVAHAVPAKIAAVHDVVDIANGRDHLLALQADGTVWAWGLGASGQLGYGESDDPDTANRAAPVVVVTDAAKSPLANVAAVFANGNTSFALLRNGQLWGWGQNSLGQLAVGDKTDRKLPVRAALHTNGSPPKYFDELFGITSFGAGVTHTLVRAKTGEVYAWGWNFRGSLGVATLANAWAQTTSVLVPFP